MAQHSEQNSFYKIQRLFLVFIGILLLFRFYDLGIRPPHHDEAVNGWFVDGMFDRGFYVYDPSNYHGPFFFYILALFTKIFGRSIEVLRLPVVLMSFVLTFSPLLFQRWIGKAASGLAVVVLAISPAVVFYSRYSIHEMGFALSCIIFFYYWLRAREGSFSTKRIWQLGLSLGVMATLKENFVIFIGSLLIAEGLAWIYERKILKIVEHRFQSASLLKWLGVVGIAFAWIVLWFSAFGQDENGLNNFFAAFVAWTDTGSNGNGHEKPFWYWLKLMGTLEWFALLGLVLAPLALRRVPTQLRLVSILSVGLWLAYSIVAYKTPWCVLSFYWGLILIAAYWVVKVLSLGRFQKLIMLVLALGFAVSTFQAYRVSYRDVDSEGHFYIYGQTLREFMGPAKRIVEMGKQNPNLYRGLRLVIVSGYTWPLPYVLGEFKNAAYYNPQTVPQKIEGDVVFMDLTFEKEMSARMVGEYQREVVRVRHWAAPMVIFTRIRN